MRSNLEALLGIDPNDPLDRLADQLVSADEKMLDELVSYRKNVAKLSQTEVARRMGISQSAVARIESGERNPHLSTLRRYAHALRLRIEHKVVAAEAEEQPVHPYTNVFERPYRVELTALVEHLV